jgi:hypothetical protein
MKNFHIEKCLVLVKKQKSLPDGHYNGTISGTIITVIHNGERYELTTGYGVRQMEPISISFKIHGETIEIH